MDAHKIKDAVETSFLAIKNIGGKTNGYQVDYSQIAQSDPYSIFKQEIAPQLNYLGLDILEDRSEKLSFWINIYNLLTLDAVVSFQVQKSVTEGFLGIFQFFRKAAYFIAGQRYSLEAIEHGILRANNGHPYLPGPQFRSNDKRKSQIIFPIENRIHFALNCASKSCPPISIYESGKLEHQLDLATRNFVDQETTLSSTGNSITTSRIFNWYSRDFGGKVGIRNFLINHLPANDPRQMFLEGSENRKIRFSKYKWALNV
jgi:hypothetical protein